MRFVYALRYLPLRGVSGEPFPAPFCKNLAQVAQEKGFNSPYWVTEVQLQAITGGCITIQSGNSVVSELDGNNNVSQPSKATIKTNADISSREESDEIVENKMWYNLEQTSDPGAATSMVQKIGKYLRKSKSCVNAMTGRRFRPPHDLYLSTRAAQENWEWNIWVAAHELPLIGDGNISPLPMCKGVTFSKPPFADKPSYTVISEHGTPDFSASDASSATQPYVYYNAQQTSDSQEVVTHFFERVHRSALTSIPLGVPLQRVLQAFSKEHRLSSPYWITDRALTLVHGSRIMPLEGAKCCIVKITFKQGKEETHHFYNAESTTDPVRLIEFARRGLMRGIWGAKPLPLHWQAELHGHAKEKGFRSNIWLTEESLRNTFQDQVHIIPGQVGITIGGSNQDEESFTLLKRRRNGTMQNKLRTLAPYGE